MAIGNKQGKVFLYRFNHFYHWDVCSQREVESGSGRDSWNGSKFGAINIEKEALKGIFCISS